MRIKAALIAVFAFAASLSASAQTLSIGLSQGDSITLRATDSGFEIVEHSANAVGLSDSERSFADIARGNPAATGQNAIRVSGADLDPSQPIEPNQITIRLLTLAPHDTVMVIDNGYDRAFTYRAVVQANGQTGRSDVCWVLPGHHGYEHWEMVIDHIELSSLRFEDWNPGDRVPCE